MMDYLEEEWRQVEMELMRERGLWGPQVGSDLDKWILDPTEGDLYKPLTHIIKIIIIIIIIIINI